MSDKKQIPSPEEVMLRYIPNGIQNIKGKGDGKPQYKAEVEVITNSMKEYAKEVVKYTLEQAAEKGLLSVHVLNTETGDTHLFERHLPVAYDTKENINETVTVDKQSILSLEAQIIKDLKL